jgi:predicted acyl esterase
VLHGRAAEPVPTIGGPSSSWAATLGAPHLVGPADATPLTLRDDVLTLRGEPLEHDLELAGRVKLTLTVTTDVAPAGIAAKLAETTPDGALRVLTDGVGTAPGAAGGAPATLHVALSPIHHRVFAGRRLVLLLSASEFPRYALGLDADRTLRIRTGGDAPSRLTLPVVGP